MDEALAFFRLADYWLVKIILKFIVFVLCFQVEVHYDYVLICPLVEFSGASLTLSFG